MDRAFLGGALAQMAKARVDRACSKSSLTENAVADSIGAGSIPATLLLRRERPPYDNATRLYSIVLVIKMCTNTIYKLSPLLVELELD